MSEAEIQCPECGGMLVHAREGMICIDCRRSFKEEEIRKRCGL